MKNKGIVIGIIVVLLLGGAYLGRHTIKSMMSGPTPTPAPSQPMTQTQTAAPADNIYQTRTDPKKGKYLTDFTGMTLYTFDKDTTNISTCYQACQKAWPYYTSGATAEKMLPAHITVTTRTDGGKQFDYDGHPLYYYSGDQKEGDLNGDGIGGIWHIVKQ